MPLGGRNSTPGDEDEDLEAARGAKELYEGIYKDIMDLTVQAILERGQKALLARLVASVESGSASHQEQAILRNILRDNGMVMATLPPDKRGTGGAALQTQTYAPIPEFTDNDGEDD